MQYRLLLAAALIAAGCHDAGDAATEPAFRSARPHLHPTAPAPESRLPVDQLLSVKRATAQYHDIERARRDGYTDLGVVIPNMGRHFLRNNLLDATFDLERPELLVYREGANGAMNLVAVEYAVPRNLSDAAPEGFRGDADVWFDDPVFHLWTLHAWVWRENPAGVFHPTNRMVP